MDDNVRCKTGGAVVWPPRPTCPQCGRRLGPGRVWRLWALGAVLLVVALSLWPYCLAVTSMAVGIPLVGGLVVAALLLLRIRPTDGG